LHSHASGQPVGNFKIRPAFTDLNHFLLDLSKGIIGRGDDTVILKKSGNLDFVKDPVLSGVKLKQSTNPVSGNRDDLKV